jgi:two-component system response regulator AtoC
MPGKLQIRLLEALQNDPLQNHELRPAQAVPPSSSARILAATSADLERALAEKKLREDLYYRLSAFTVRVPPLRQRKEEITILLRYSMHQMARHYGLPAREFTSVMLSNCQSYNWPGNLSELEAFVKRYLVSGDQGLAPGGIELHTHTTGATQTFRASVMPIAAADRTRQDGPAAQAGAPQSLKLFIQGIKCEAEKNAIGAALEKTGWNRKAAARLLKVSYRTLLYKIEQYQMTASLPSLSATSARYGAEGNENKESGR